jgi:hypothetical protein
MNIELMVRTASALPEGDPERRLLVAALRVAVSPDTEDFVEWVLATQKPMTETEMVRFLEAKLGRTPTPAPAKGQSARKSGPLDIGEKVLVDKTKNTNTLNTDACEQYHNRVAQVSDKVGEGLVVQFYEGNNDTPSDTLTAEKQFFNGFASGSKTGLYRWTPRTDYQEHNVEKKVLFEAVYLRGGTTVDIRHTEQIEEYINKGTLQGETRSTVYYTGVVGRFAENQQGEVYFGLSSMQRDQPVSINPKKGKLLYLGLAGKRPGGWKEEAIQLGLRVEP